MPLAGYRRKRNFQKTPEPAGKSAKKRRSKTAPAFVVQQHAARRLHYDFRLELGGVLKSWAVPKGPCLDPSVKRLAVEVEDHPLEYAKFEGAIPRGEYGAGEVIVWDRGSWQPPPHAEKDLRRGKLEFELAGEKLRGGWVLLRMAERERGRGNRKNWLLIKRQDEASRPLGEFDVTAELPQSVSSGRTLDELKSTEKQSARLPATIDVQLATPAAEVPRGSQWVHEIKFDGYRLVARIARGKVQLLTRNHLDWTRRYAAIARALESLPAESAILDGEVVAQLEDGTSSFQALQNALRDGTSERLVYYAFDLLHLNGVDLGPLALDERKELLKELLSNNRHPQIQFTDHWEGDGSRFLKACRDRGLEGIISKRRDRPYRSGRSPDWLKIKCVLQEELVIGGFTASPVRHRAFGALLLGYFDGADLIYAGRVGTGFDAASLADLRQRLDKLVAKASPFNAVPARERTGVTWVRPQLVAQIEFGGWTDAGILRHPSFQGLREDKPAAEVGRPESLTSAGPSTSKGKAMRPTAPRRGKRQPATSSKDSPAELPVRLTNPDRVLFPDIGLTKRGLAEYYAAVAPWILPHLADRPLSLLRCPKGQAGTCFFQKHAAGGTPDALRRIEIEEKNETEEYLIADDLPGLLALAQISILEIHPWGSRGDRLKHPDRLIFDLDPGPDVPWPEVVQSAFAMRDALARMKLQSFVKTTGGKGLHVVLPLSPRRYTWSAAKAFARSVAEHFATKEPQRYVATMSKARRQGKIFIDYFRNDRGATAVAPYSTRAKPGAPVSCPLTWDELSSKVRSDSFTVGNVVPRLAGLKNDPWEGFFDLKQPLPKSVQ